MKWDRPTHSLRFTSFEEMPSLFIDILGTKNIWRAGGRTAVAKRFSEFEQLLGDALGAAAGEKSFDIEIESDSAILHSADASRIAMLGREIFRTAFARPLKPPFWLRGVIVPGGEPGSWRTPRKEMHSAGSIIVHDLSDSLLEAINVERAGCKGMRLLIHRDLVTQDLRRDTRLTYRGRNLMPIRPLESADYPETVKDYQDILWMAAESDEDWATWKRMMAERLRASFGSSEALMQAAATQVLFHQCNAIMHSIRLQAESKASRTLDTSGRPREM